MKHSAICLAVLLVLHGQALAQGSAGTAGKGEPRYLVDMPTAGMLAKGHFAVDIDFYQDGGILGGLSAGIFDRLAIGVSYGGSQLLGSRSPVLNPAPGVAVKLRVIEESLGFPAIVLGFDSQGKGGYLKDRERYRVKSPGLYAAASKNYLLAGYFSLHGGVNYSFERADGDRSFNLFAGAEKTLGPFLSLLAEYNLAVNDDGGEALGKGRGYLNLAVKWSFAGGVTLGVNFHDLLKNSRDAELVTRTARLEVVAGF